MGFLGTLGLVIGALALAMGLALILLPLDFQSASPQMVNQFKASNGAAILKIQVPNATFSLGGGSLTIQWATAATTPITAFLYTLSEGEWVWAGNQPTTAALSSQSVPASQGSLSASSLHPGDWYALLLYENSTEVASVSVTWSGSLFLPYAELGIPLTGIGAIILVATIALSRPRPTPDEAATAYETTPESYAFASGTPMVMEPALASPAPMLALESPPSDPSFSSAPLAEPQASPVLPPSSATAPKIVLPPDEPPPRRSWRATPLGRLGGGRSAVVPQTDLAPGRPLVATSPDAPKAGAAAAPSGSGDPFKCPRCGLVIGDESWLFCPRCRAGLD